ncbi:MAG: hypothetical protein ACKVP4_01020 [Hyphomicrobium sp.]
MTEQLVFSRMMAEAEAQQRAALDRHRGSVQAWFDALSIGDKNQIAEWMTTFEWDTCAALSAAAGDWRRSQYAANDATVRTVGDEHHGGAR